MNLLLIFQLFMYVWLVEGGSVESRFWVINWDQGSLVNINNGPQQPDTNQEYTIEKAMWMVSASVHEFNLLMGPKISWCECEWYLFLNCFCDSRAIIYFVDEALKVSNFACHQNHLFRKVTTVRKLMAAIEWWCHVYPRWGRFDGRNRLIFADLLVFSDSFSSKQ